jgi:hypothetical protein
MLHTINFQITCDDAAHALNTYPPVAGINKCARIPIEPVRGGGTHTGYIIGPGSGLHEVIAPWQSSADLPERNVIPLGRVFLRGLSGEIFNVSVQLR